MSDETREAFEAEFARYCTRLTQPKLAESHRQFAHRVAEHFWRAALAAQKEDETTTTETVIGPPGSVIEGPHTVVTTGLWHPEEKQ